MCGVGGSFLVSPVWRETWRVPASGVERESQWGGRAGGGCGSAGGGGSFLVAACRRAPDRHEHPQGGEYRGEERSRVPFTAWPLHFGFNI